MRGRNCINCRFGQWKNWKEDFKICNNCVLGSKWEPLAISQREGVVKCSKVLDIGTKESVSILNDVVDAVGSLHSN